MILYLYKEIGMTFPFNEGVPGSHPWDDPNIYDRSYEGGILPPSGGVDPSRFPHQYAYQDALRIDWIRMHEPQTGSHGGYTPQPTTAAPDTHRKVQPVEKNAPPDTEKLIREAW